MKRRLFFGLVAAALAVNLLVGARVYTNAATTTGQNAAYPNLRLFSEVLEKVRRDYVDAGNLTYQQLVYGALKGMVNTLDPHSEFLDPKEYQALQNDTEGKFGGLGLVVGMKNNLITVIAPMENSPGARAGLASGDRITKINGRSTRGVSLNQAVNQLRGDPGTKVTITVFRSSSGQTKDYTLTREVINQDMVKDINNKKQFPLGPDKIGYVRLVQFGDKTSRDLETALDKLKAQGMQALILDLRWNPGGLLDQAVDVCQKFLPRGQLVVSTEGHNPAQDTKRFAEGRGDELMGRDGAPMPMVVLVNSWSASASEIVAGCLQDLHRAVIVGERTFGKGSVQSIIPLDDGSALRLTTAKYYTPSHRVIHEVGITPNVPVPLSDEQDRELQIKLTPGGLESLPAKQREQIETMPDPQLERAEDLLKGILLFAQRSPGRAGLPENKMAALQESR